MLNYLFDNIYLIEFSEYARKKQNHKDKTNLSFSRVLHSKEVSCKIISDISLVNDSITEDWLTLFK